MAVHILDLGPVGPLIPVGLGVDQVHAMAGLGGAPRTFSALVDTGAIRTAISTAARQVLQPRRVGRYAIYRPGGGRSSASSFDVRLKFEGHLASFPWFDLEVIEADPATPGVDVLIGQDLLIQLTMVYNGPLGKLVVMY